MYLTSIFRLLREGMELLISAAAGMWGWVSGIRGASFNQRWARWRPSAPSPQPAGGVEQGREATHMTSYSLLINHLIAWQTLSFWVTYDDLYFQGFRLSLSSVVQSGRFTWAVHTLFTNKCRWSFLHNSLQKQIELCLYGWITKVNSICYCCSSRE